MTRIQLLLIFLVGLGMLGYLFTFRSRLLDRAVVVAVGLTGLLMIAWPDGSQLIADWLGVTRGVDVVTYLSLVGLGWICMLLYARLRETDIRLTQLAREIALEHARPPQAPHSDR